MNDNKQTTMEENNQTSCPICGAAIPSDAKTCPHCKETLWSDEVPEEFGGGGANEASVGTPPPMLGEICNRDFRPEPDMEPEVEIEQPRRVSGWLNFFVFIMVMSIIKTVAAILTEPLYTPLLAEEIAMVGLTVYALVRIKQGGSNAVFLCRSLLLINLVSATCMMLINAQFMGRIPAPVVTSVAQIVVCILWLGYFNSSAQVERLFPAEERSHSTVDVAVVALTAMLALYAAYFVGGMVGRLA